MTTRPAKKAAVRAIMAANGDEIWRLLAEILQRDPKDDPIHPRIVYAERVERLVRFEHECQMFIASGGVGPVPVLAPDRAHVQ